MTRVALVTCALFPELTDDDRLVAAALAERGAEVLVWDWQRPSPGDADLVVLRSPWNYPEHPEAFRRWLDERAVDGRLVNSAPAVRWNLHKGYLAQLAGAGVPCVPTVVLPGARPATCRRSSGRTAGRTWSSSPPSAARRATRCTRRASGRAPPPGTCAR